MFFCGDKALKAPAPVGVCVAHPGGLSVVALGYTWFRPLASTAFSFSGFFSFFGSLFLGCQSSVHGTSPMCDRYSHELLFQLVPVGHFLCFLPGLSTTRCCDCLRRSWGLCPFLLRWSIRSLSSASSCCVGAWTRPPSSLDDSFFRRSPPFHRFSVIRTACDDTFVLAAFCRRFFLSLSCFSLCGFLPSTLGAKFLVLRWAGGHHLFFLR